MTGTGFIAANMRERIALLLVAAALLLRVMIPAGWMPTAGAGYAITLCTGAGVVSAWVDANGTIHKDKPSPAYGAEHPCVFAGFAAALIAPAPVDVVAALPALAAATLIGWVFEQAVGRGLAAPPPPPTGPPASL